MGSSNNDFNSPPAVPSTSSTSSSGNSPSSSLTEGGGSSQPSSSSRALSLSPFMTTDPDPFVLYRQGEKKNASRAVQTECLRSSHFTPGLNQILDDLLDPRKSLSDSETISWLNYLIAGGRNPEEFSQIVKSFDNAVSCGLVWTANFVAYRCRTCGISPCMSLCAECFQKGNHEGHDYNMFRSQAGGACDCGDPSVMKESGFCSCHQPGVSDRKPKAPHDLTCVGKVILPRLLHRLLVQLRKNSPDALQESEEFVTGVLNSMTEMGAAMRAVMTSSLVESSFYASLSMKCDWTRDPVVAELLLERYQNYEQAVKELSSFTPDPSFHRECTVCPGEAPQAIRAFNPDLHHSSFAEELLFWTIVYKFPQNLVCFLLNMLPENKYKNHFAEAFVNHYTRVAMMQAKFRHEEDSPLAGQSRPSAHDLLSNCVVHVSVQLFSNEPLAARLCREHHLIHVMIASLRATIEGAEGDGLPGDESGIRIRSALQNSPESPNRHHVVRCDHYIMRRHSYWPLASDLNNILTHLPVAMILLNDSCLLESWMNFIMNFQSMNLNTRELEEHVEYENESYYAAFSAELEICATPVWTLISHLKDGSTAHLTRGILQVARATLEKWFELINFSSDKVKPHEYQATFHIPLHRYYAIFLQHGVANQGMSLDFLLPHSESQLKIFLAHPLQVMISFYEILCGLWVRNGLQMKGQAMTYIQCHFCNSMIDPDLFLIQTCASRLNPDWFIETVFERFHVWEWLSFSYTKERPFRREGFLEPDQVMPMLEGALTFLASLFAVRTNLGMSEKDVTRQEMVTLLSIADRTYSQLADMLPEKCGTTGQNKDFEDLLPAIADFKQPTYEACGNLTQGMYYPKHDIWEKEYDPLHVLLRAVHRRDYQSSMDRFTSFVKQSGRCSATPWPPFRLPTDPDLAKFVDPRKLLYSKVLHGVLFTILYKALYVNDVTDQVLSLTVYLLEMALNYPSPRSSSCIPVTEEVKSYFCVNDLKFGEWFTSDWLLINFNTTVQNISTPINEKESSLTTASEPSVEEMEVIFTSSDDSDGEYASADEDDDAMDTSDGDVTDGSRSTSAFRSIEGGPIPHSLTSAPIPLALPAPTTQTELPSPSTSSALVAVHPAPAPVSPTSPPTNPGATLGPPAVPGPSTSPGTNALEFMQPLRSRFRRRLGHTRQRHRLPPPCEDAARSAPAGCYREGDDDFLERWALTSSSTSNLTHTPVPVEESILSLLLRLHSKLSNEPDSYRPGPIASGRIGDGPFFIKRVLDTYVQLNASNGMTAVKNWRRKLWPQSVPAEESGMAEDGGGDVGGKNRRNELEERRRKAKERQQKLMAEFASRQKAFMKKMEMDSSMKDGEEDGDVQGEGTAGNETDRASPSTSASTSSFKQPEYECVICSQTTPSTKDKLIGMVALLQSTSVLAHCLTSENEQVSDELPCDEEQVEKLSKRTTFSNYMEYKLDKFVKNFNEQSWQKSLSIGWEGGVHVQSCGHFLHLDCHKSYIQSLRSQQGNHNRQGSDPGEFNCPLCRQTANSVLPVNPEVPGALTPSRPSDTIEVYREISELLKNMDPPDKSLVKLLGSFMEDLTKATLPQYRNIHSTPTTQSLLLFLCSIARTNIETDVLVRTSKSIPVGAKKACFTPLYQVLALNSKVFMEQSYYPLWTQLTGLSELDYLKNSLVHVEMEVPILLKDPIALMIQLLFSLPVNLDRTYFKCVIQALFNLTVVQSLAQLSCLISPKMRGALKEMFTAQSANAGVESFTISLQTFMGLVIDVLSQSSLYINSPEDGSSDIRLVTLSDLRNGLRSLSLPLLRSAAVLQSHLYGIEYPIVEDDEGSEGEFAALRKSLGVSTGACPEDLILDSVSFPIKTPSVVVRLWCQEFNGLAQRTSVTAEKLLRSKPIHLQRPRLLRLPATYDQLFLFYHQRVCNNCKKHPKEPCICLVCGTLICMRESCCRSNNTLEAVSHSAVCGAGTAVYLAINSSTVIVIRGKKACVWGSVFLDCHGEEDRDLKRGKPLFLSAERYWFLEQQWLTHSFDHTSKRWVWHKDTL